MPEIAFHVTRGRTSFGCQHKTMTRFSNRAHVRCFDGRTMEETEDALIGLGTETTTCTPCPGDIMSCGEDGDDGSDDEQVASTTDISVNFILSGISVQRTLGTRPTRPTSDSAPIFRKIIMEKLWHISLSYARSRSHTFHIKGLFYRRYLFSAFYR